MGDACAEGQKEQKKNCVTTRIAALNDRLRKSGAGGQVVVTSGIASLPALRLSAVLDAVRRCAAFTPENDPYHEHDCALLAVEGLNVLWKIDYYDTSLRYHSSDPADPDVTCRVLTIMLADEY